MEFLTKFGIDEGAIAFRQKDDVLTIIPGELGAKFKQDYFDKDEIAIEKETDKKIINKPIKVLLGDGYPIRGNEEGIINEHELKSTLINDGVPLSELKPDMQNSMYLLFKFYLDIIKEKNRLEKLRQAIINDITNANITLQHFIENLVKSHDNATKANELLNSVESSYNGALTSVKNASEETTEAANSAEKLTSNVKVYIKGFNNINNEINRKNNDYKVKNNDIEVFINNLKLPRQ